MRARRCVVGIMLAVLWTAVPTGAQTSSDLFDDSAVRDIRLRLHSGDLAQLREYYDENTYYPADFEWQGLRIRNVGVRSRGSGSRSQTKLGLRVDFNRFTTGQRFLGLTAVVLDNLWQDPSMVRERLAMKLFARAGLPAPREAFVRVFINDEYEGVYAVTDDVNAAFLEQALGLEGAYLFEFKWIRPYYAEYLGGDTAPYVPLFEARTHEQQAEETLYGPIRELTREAASDGPSWHEAVGRYLDLPVFVDYLAVEAFVAQLDGVAGYAGMNNFYLYRPQQEMRQALIPWDQDHAFFDPTASIWLRADENALVRGALAVPELRARYLETLAWLCAAASEGQWLAAELERMLAQVDQPAREDGRKPFPEEERARANEAMRAFVAGRASTVLEEVAAAQRAAARRR